MTSPVRTILFALLAPLLGGTGRRIAAKLLFNAQIHRSASIGICVIDAAKLHMGPRSRLGHFTVLRNLDEVLLEEDGRVGTFNWIFGAQGTSHFHEETSRKSSLIIRAGASVTSRHILDCTDTIEIGRFATVAGFRTQILTHSIDIDRNRQSCAPVTIGAFSFIGTGSTVLKGSYFPDESVLAAGSVFFGRDKPARTVYSGVPATPLRSVPESAEYMKRMSSHVS